MFTNLTSSDPQPLKLPSVQEVGSDLSEKHVRRAFSRVFNVIDPNFLQNGPPSQNATGFDVLKSILANSIVIELRIKLEGLDRIEAMAIIYQTTDRLTANSVWVAPANPNAGVPGSRGRSRSGRVVDHTPAVLLLEDGTSLIV